MNTNDESTKQKIINITKILINEVNDIEKITVRQIAERSGVGIGLINYHFNSKDNLLSIAIGDIMTEAINKFTKINSNTLLTPISKLKILLKELYSLSGTNERLIRFILSREVLNGNFKTALFLVPLLKEIYGNQIDDIQLKIITLQILHPIQVTGLNQAAFHMYSGLDLNNPEQRDHFIELLVDNLILNEKERR